MGGVIDTIFGGSKNKSESKQSSVSNSTSNSVSNSESGNKAYDYIMSTMDPNVRQGNAAFGQIGALLGLGGDAGAAKAGYDNFLTSSGYQNIFDQAMKGVTGSASAKGMLNSGATLKALQDRGSGLAQQSFGNYLDRLGGMFTGGQQSAQQIGSAGQFSKANSTSTSNSNSSSTGTSTGSGYSKNGIFNSLFPGGLSDARLKTKLVWLGRNSQGIGVYEFEFKTAPHEKHIGVIAQEVEYLLPEALGPETVDGYKTVDYGKVQPLMSVGFTPQVIKELVDVRG